jgi:cell division protein FtsQ
VLGDDDFSERVRRFVRLYQGELGARKEQLARVDLRYDNGLAVGFREPAQVAGL